MLFREEIETARRIRSRLFALDELGKPLSDSSGLVPRFVALEVDARERRLGTLCRLPEDVIAASAVIGESVFVSLLFSSSNCCRAIWMKVDSKIKIIHCSAPTI